LSQPENARRLFRSECPREERGSASEMRARLLEEWIARLEQRDLLVHILASYQLRNICHDYCPPIHLQQLKKPWFRGRIQARRGYSETISRAPILDAAHR